MATVIARVCQFRVLSLFEKQDSKTAASRKADYYCYYMIGTIVLAASVLYIICTIRIFFGESGSVQYTGLYSIH